MAARAMNAGMKMDRKEVMTREDGEDEALNITKRSTRMDEKMGLQARQIQIQTQGPTSRNSWNYLAIGSNLDICGG
jgi:hypothetical protein